MRHRVSGRKLGRTSAHRKAMFRNQLTALFTHERIITTVAKAKDLRPLAERMVTIARKDTLQGRREVLRWVPDKEVVRRLFDDVAPRFAGRPGGYTRILRLGRRHGDGAELAIIEFVDYEPGDVEGGGDSKAKGSLMDRAKGMFGGRQADTVDEADEVETAAAEDEVEVAAEEPAEEKPKKAKASKKAKQADEPAPADEETAVEASEAEPKADADEVQEAEAPEAEDTEAEPAADDEDEKKDTK